MSYQDTFVIGSTVGTGFSPSRARNSGSLPSAPNVPPQAAPSWPPAPKETKSENKNHNMFGWWHNVMRPYETSRVVTANISPFSEVKTDSNLTEVLGEQTGNQVQQQLAPRAMPSDSRSPTMESSSVAPSQASAAACTRVFMPPDYCYTAGSTADSVLSSRGHFSVQSAPATAPRPPQKGAENAGFAFKVPISAHPSPQLTSCFIADQTGVPESNYSHADDAYIPPTPTLPTESILRDPLVTLQQEGFGSSKMGWSEKQIADLDLEGAINTDIPRSSLKAPWAVIHVVWLIMAVLLLLGGVVVLLVVLGVVA